VQAISTAANGKHPMFISVDFEFYIPLAMFFFLSKQPLVPMIAPGHLLKACTVSMMSFYEMAIFRPHLQALGHEPDTPKYKKIMGGGHITKSIKVMVKALLYSVPFF
jgi:hypothetical protein